MKILVSYIPVLHEGYQRLFQKHKDAEILYILGKDFLSEKPLSKDIRALDPGAALKALEGWKIFKEIRILKRDDLGALDKKENEIVSPEDELMRQLLSGFKNAKVIFEQIFLRWDKHKSMEMKPMEGAAKISENDFVRDVLKELKEEAEKKSSDIWRRIGGAVAKNGKVILSAYNKHLPSEHAPFVAGDPRNNFSKGICVELGTSMHSEASLIAQAAKRGISLEGADIYVSTFPCPPCAKLISQSGIKRLYYSGGYGVLDGGEVLKDAGVEIIYVDLNA